MFEERALGDHALEGWRDRRNDSRRRPFSLGRIGRVVAEIESTRSGSMPSSRREIVVLPAPEGDESTSIRPRR
jgi:hypothetical protein